jgi:hypothetical protein
MFASGADAVDRLVARVQSHAPLLPGLRTPRDAVAQPVGPQQLGLLADRGYDAQTNRQLLRAHGLRDGIARRAKPGQERRVRLDARNKAINRVRARA